MLLAGKVQFVPLSLTNSPGKADHCQRNASCLGWLPRMCHLPSLSSDRLRRTDEPRFFLDKKSNSLVISTHITYQDHFHPIIALPRLIFTTSIPQGDRASSMISFSFFLICSSAVTLKTRTAAAKITTVPTLFQGTSLLPRYRAWCGS